MSLFGSLFTGVSGLGAQSRAMGIISDNVANVNTTAYKGSQTHFSSLVTGANSARSHAPGGVRASAAQLVDNQGVIQNSGSPTDAAISGGGFFVVNSLRDGTGEQLYTRAGSFNADFAGNLRTPEGFYVQGWALNADEEIVDVNKLETVNVSMVNGLATATTSVSLGANLDADQDIAAAAPHFTRTIEVYDSLGRPQNMTVGFTKTAANEWDVAITSNDVDTGSHPGGVVANGTITFNGDGSLSAAALPDPVSVTWDAASGAEDSSISFDFGQPGGTNGLTQFASPTSVAFVEQNGAEVGELNGVSIDESGYVVASFTNGEQRRLFQLPISTFANPGALSARSGNVFAQTEGSGEFNLKVAGRGGAGRLTPEALETANVDLADEFTKMIVTQRAYSANARVITTTNDMLNELIQISR